MKIVFYSVLILCSIPVHNVCAAVVPASYVQPKKIAADIPLETIYEYQGFLKNIHNIPQLQVPSPKTQYLWQNMSRVFKTEMVLRDGSISELSSRVDSRIGSLPFSLKNGQRYTVNDYFNQSTMDAMIVVHKGAIVHEQYKTMRPFDKHNWFSVGKTIGGILVALLEDQGKVDVSKPVSLYVPALKGSVWDTVSVEETLDMATGLDSTEHEEPGDDSTTNSARGWYQWAVTMGIFEGERRGESPVAFLRQMKRTKPGHTAFEYNSIDTWVLELIVEQVTGKPLNEAFGSAIWRAIGAQADGFVGITDDGYSMAWGFVSSTLRDLARYGLIYTPSWAKTSKKQIVSSAMLNKIQQGGKPDIFDKGAVGRSELALFFETDLKNHYQWDVVFPDGDLFKGGVGGQGLYISPSRDLVIAWFSTGQNPARVMAREIAKAALFTPADISSEIAPMKRRK